VRRCPPTLHSWVHSRRGEDSRGGARLRYTVGHLLDRMGCRGRRYPPTLHSWALFRVARRSRLPLSRFPRRLGKLVAEGRELAGAGPEGRSVSPIPRARVSAVRRRELALRRGPAAREDADVDRLRVGV
jgi:hypothetical protein